MMRDHVVGRTSSCGRAAYGNAQRSGEPFGTLMSASALSSNGSVTSHSRSLFGKTYRSARAVLRNACGKMAATALSLALALTCVPVAGVAYAADGDAVEPDAPAGAELGDPIDAADTTADESVADAPRFSEEVQLERIIASGEATRSFFLASTLRDTTVPIVQATLALAPTNSDGNENGSADPADAGPASGTAVPQVTGSFVHDGLTYAVTGEGEMALAAIDATRLPADALSDGALVLPAKASLSKSEEYALTSIMPRVFGDLRITRDSEVVNAASAAERDGASGESESSEPVSEEGDDADSDPDADVGADGGPTGFDSDDGTASDGSTDVAVSATAAHHVVCLGIPATVNDIAADAFANYEPLEHLVVAEGNSAYSSYDGVLYDADRTSLLLIPEGRQGAVRIAPTVTNVPAEMFSHRSGLALVVDAGSTALTSEDGFLYNIDLADFDFPVPVAITDGDSIVAATPGFGPYERMLDNAVNAYDESWIAEQLAADPKAIDLWQEEESEENAIALGVPIDGESSAASQADSAAGFFGELNEGATKNAEGPDEHASAYLEDAADMEGIAPETLEEVQPFAPSTVINHTFDLRTTAAGQTGENARASSEPTTVEEDVIVGEGENAVNYSEHQKLDTVSGIGEAYWYLKRTITTTPPATAGAAETVEKTVTLYIDCTEGAEIAESNFVSTKDDEVLNGWHWSYVQSGAWAPVRSLVNRIVMSPTVRPEGTMYGTGSMMNWFFMMGNLTDISQVFVPEGVKSIAMLFMDCRSLKLIPGTLTVGEGVEDVGNVFQNTSVETLESGFKLPSTVKRTHCMFMNAPLKTIQPGFTLPDGVQQCGKMFSGCSELEALPAGFTIPASVVRADQMFAWCTSLETLPAGFTVAEGVQYVQRMFTGCTSLKRLPEGFSLPKASVRSNFPTDPDYNGDIPGKTYYENTFSDCPALNALPDSFDFDLAKAEASESFFTYSGEKSDLTDANGNLITYYTGASSAVKNYTGWLGSAPSQKRVLRGAPAGALKTLFMIPAGNTLEGITWEPWAVVYTDSAKRIPESGAPGTPSMEHFEFSGSWYASSNLTAESKFAFDSTVLKSESDGLARLYAGYSIIGDKLATLTNGVPDPHPRASWQLEFADKYSTDEEGGLVVDRTTTLRISCEEGAEIANSNFVSKRMVDGKEETAYEWQFGYSHSGAWAAVRSRVQRIVMDADVRPEGTTRGKGSMYSWFSRMPLLVDIENVFVPNGVSNITMLFLYDGSLETVPSAFTLGEGVEKAGNLFQGTKVAEVEEGFTLPSTVKEIQCFFLGTPIRAIPAGFMIPEGVSATYRMFSDCRSLESLPAGFALPSSIRIAYGMFANCSELESLPVGFTVPEGTEYIQQMFQGCSSLKTLPEGFSLPKASLKATYGDDEVPDTNDINGQGALERVFRGCDALTVLPDSFDFNLEQANTSKDFFIYSGSGAESGTIDANGNLITYYTGGSSSVKIYPGWTGSSPSQKRVLQGVPAKCLKVQFMVPDDSTSNGWSAWTSRITGIDKKLPESADPGEPALGFFDFAGWYTSESLDAASLFAFGSTVLTAVPGSPTMARLYAKCDRIGGNLDTITGGMPDTVPRASWRIATDIQTNFDGTQKEVTTLFIDSEPNTEIAHSNFVSTWQEGDETKTDHRWWYNRSRSGAWESVRSKVDRVVMSKNVKPEGSSEGNGDMMCWFYNMPRLTDISAVFVPEGVNDVTMLFYKCEALSYVPATFTLGEGVKLAGNLFQNTAIDAIGEGFVLPSTVTDVHCMFLGTKIKTLPAGFTLPDGVDTVFRMFSGCHSLQSLPAGFKLPDSTKIAYGMFANCIKLESLPAGFTVPEGAEYIQQFFANCKMLETLPEGFSLPKNSLKASRGADKLTDLSRDDMGALGFVFTGCDALKDLPASFDFNLSQANDSENFFNYTGEKEEGTTDANGNLVTLYLGSNASVLNYAGWTGVSPSQKRILRSTTELAKEGLSVVRFALPNAGHGAYDLSLDPEYYVTVSSLSAGTVAYPGAPKAFGYAFDELRGWRAGLDVSGTYPSTTSYNFAQTLASQLTPDKTEQIDVGGGVKKPLSYYTIYAHLTGPIYNVSVPVSANVSLDTLFGNTPVPADLVFDSLTPEPLLVTRVSGGLNYAASALFASADDFDKASMEASIALGDGTAKFILPKVASDGTLVTSSWQELGETAVIPKSVGFRTHLKGALELTVTGARPIVNNTVGNVARLIWQVEDPAIGELVVG